MGAPLGDLEPEAVGGGVILLQPGLESLGALEQKRGGVGLDGESDRQRRMECAARASAVRCTVAWALVHRHGLKGPAWPEPARQSRSSHDDVRSRYPARLHLAIRPRCQQGVGHERLVLAGIACSRSTPTAASPFGRVPNGRSSRPRTQHLNPEATFTPRAGRREAVS